MYFTVTLRIIWHRILRAIWHTGPTSFYMITRIFTAGLTNSLATRTPIPKCSEARLKDYVEIPKGVNNRRSSSSGKKPSEEPISPIL